MSLQDKPKSEKYIATKKPVSKEESEQAQYEANLRIKKTNIKAEFEKHKREFFANISDTSKASENKLRAQIDEMIANNLKKKQNLENLIKMKKRIEKKEEETSPLRELALLPKTSSKFNTTYLSVEAHPNRTTTNFGESKDNQIARAIVDKIKELEEMLLNINLLTEQEDEASAAVKEKLDELTDNNVLLTKKVKELEALNGHAEKRFSDLKQVELRAKNKYAITLSFLNGQKKDIKENMMHETMSKNIHKEHGLNVNQATNNLHTEFSKLLLSLEEHRAIDKQLENHLNKLELLHEEMVDKNKITRAVISYIDIFETLEKFLPNLSNESNTNINELIESPLQTQGDSKGDKKSVASRSTSAGKTMMNDRKVYLTKLYQFYEKNAGGPVKLSDQIIAKYTELQMIGNSLKTEFEDLQNQKIQLKKQANGLRALLREIQEKSEDISEEIEGKKSHRKIVSENWGGQGSVLKNPAESLISFDSGMVAHGSKLTTISQIKDALEVQKSTEERALKRLTDMRSFLMRCYLCILKIMNRIAIIVQSLGKKGNELVPVEVRHKAQEIISHVKLFFGEKGTIRETENYPLGEDYGDRKDSIKLQNYHYQEESEVAHSMNIFEVKRVCFLVFGEDSQKTEEFVQKIAHSVLITSFLNSSDVETYLMNHRSIFPLNARIERAIDGVSELEAKALMTMIQRFRTVFGQYVGLLSKVKEIQGERFMDLSKEGEANLNTATSKSANSKVKILFEGGAAAAVGQDSSVDIDNGNVLRTENDDSQDVIKTECSEDNKNIEATYEKLDIKDLKSKIEELASSKMKKARDKYITSKNTSKSRIAKKNASMSQSKERVKATGGTEEDQLEQERRRIKRHETEFPKYLDDSSSKQSLTTTQSFSKNMMIQEELKRMIKSSKLISKISILERKMTPTDAKRNFGDFVIDNYAPVRPKGISRPSTRLSKDFLYENSSLSRSMKSFTHNESKTRNLNRTSQTQHSVSTDRGKPDDAFYSSYGNKYPPDPLLRIKYKEDSLDKEERKTSYQKVFDLIRKVQANEKLLKGSRSPSTESKFRNTVASQSEMKNKAFMYREVGNCERLLSEPTEDEGGKEDSVVKGKSHTSENFPKIRKKFTRTKSEESRKFKNFRITSNVEGKDSLVNAERDPASSSVVIPKINGTVNTGHSMEKEDLENKLGIYKTNIPSILVGKIQ